MDSALGETMAGVYKCECGKEHKYKTNQQLVAEHWNNRNWWPAPTVISRRICECGKRFTIGGEVEVAPTK